jgi:hypothetical protein
MPTPSEIIDVEPTEDGVNLRGTTGVLAALSDEAAVALAKRILHLVVGTAEVTEQTYQKSLG